MDNPFVLTGVITIIGLVIIGLGRYWLKRRQSKTQPETEKRIFDPFNVADQIQFSLNQMILDYSDGTGISPRTMSGNLEVIYQEDFNPDVHNPQHINQFKTRIDPRGMTMVDVVEVPHAEKVLVVVDIACPPGVNPDVGSPDDNIAGPEFSCLVAEAIVIATGKFPTGILGPGPETNPIYLDPGSTIADLGAKIEQFGVRRTPDQAEEFLMTYRQMAVGAKGIIIVSDFQQSSSRQLLKRLVPGQTITAIQVAGGWDFGFSFEGMPKRINLGINDQIQPTKTENFDRDYRADCQQDQAKLEQICQTNQIHLMTIRRHHPDLESQVIDGFAELMAA